MIFHVQNILRFHKVWCSVIKEDTVENNIYRLIECDMKNVRIFCFKDIKETVAGEVFLHWVLFFPQCRTCHRVFPLCGICTFTLLSYFTYLCELHLQLGLGLNQLHTALAEGSVHSGALSCQILGGLLQDSLHEQSDTHKEPYYIHWKL